MDQLQDAKLANLSVDGAAVGAVLGLSALLVDLFADLRAAQVVDERPAELGEKLAALRLLQQDTAAVLADLLQDGDDEAQVAYVEDGQREPDVAKVAIAVLQRLVASSALARLARGAELVVEGSILVRRAVVLDVVEESVGNFGDGLVGDILVGPEY